MLTTKLVIVHIHYHNPERSRFKDNSGLRISYTDQLRKNKMGVLITGVNEKELKIPPGQKNTTLTDLCTANCTNRLPASGFNIFGGLLHGHEFLRRIRLEIKYKNGTKDDNTLRSDHYSFNNQYMKYLSEFMIIQPGDTIKTICEFDTSNTNLPVEGGPGSNNEMCVGFIFY